MGEGHLWASRGAAASEMYSNKNSLDQIVHYDFGANVIFLKINPFKYKYLLINNLEIYFDKQF